MNSITKCLEDTMKRHSRIKENLVIRVSESPVAVWATNRKMLIDMCNSVIGQVGISEDMVYLHIESECGSVDYKTEDDVPSHSVPCPCGNPEHWLIKYKEET